MRRALLRLVMASVGVLSVLFYAAGAYLLYRLFVSLWMDRPSATTTVLVVAAVTLLVGYAGHRLGMRRVLETVTAAEPPRERTGTFAERLDRLCDRMALEAPTVRFTDLGGPNAFALNGPDGGTVVVDVTLFDVLDDDGMEAILAHELAHLESRDGLVQSVAFTGLQTVTSTVSLAVLPLLVLLTGLAKGTAWLRGRPSTWPGTLAWRTRGVVLGAVTVLPVVCTLVLLGRSRRREYAADGRAAAVTGDPLALARALRAVDEAVREELRLQGALVDDSAPSAPLYRLLSTHPAIDDRIARLEALAAG